MQIAQQDIRQLTYVGSPGQPERTFVTLQAPIRQAAFRPVLQIMIGN